MLANIIFRHTNNQRKISSRINKNAFQNDEIYLLSAICYPRLYLKMANHTHCIPVSLNKIIQYRKANLIHYISNVIASIFYFFTETLLQFYMYDTTNKKNK